MSKPDFNSNDAPSTTKRKSHQHGKWRMLICLIPIVAIMALPALGVNLGQYGRFAFLICPLLHIGMMVMMHRSGKGGACCEDHSAQEQKSVGA